MPHRLTCLIAILLLGSLVTSCLKKHPRETSFRIHGFTGTVYTAESNARNIGQISGLLRRNVDTVLTAIGDHRPENEIAKLNRVGDSVRLPVSQLTFRALDLARYYGELTGGAFDITLSEASRLWLKGTPNQLELEQVMRRSGAHLIEASDNNSIALLAPGMKLATGLLAPAYAVDTGIVDMRRMVKGPTLYTLNSFARQEGSFDTGSPPMASVEPHGLPLLGKIDLHRHRAMAVVSMNQPTPGTNNPTAVIRIDPRSGQPASGAIAVAAIGPLTIKAYALAEALLVLGIDDGAPIMQNFPGYDVMVVVMSNPIIAHATPGFREVFVQDEQTAMDVRDWIIATKSPNVLDDFLETGKGAVPFIEGLSDDSADQIFVAEPD